MNSINPERGLDFHLRLLGITDRADWSIQARDNRNYVTDLIYGRPDWVLRHNQGYYRTYEYKNRVLGEDGDATDYEKYQAAIYGFLVQDVIGRETGTIPEITSHILYADSQCLQVEFGAEELDLIGNAATEAGTALYFRKIYPEPKQRISATDLARYLVDPNFTNPAFGRTAAQLAGTRAHDLLLHSGPIFH